MMKRRQLSPDFKARVALAAIKGEVTISEISSKFQVHSSQIIRWKKQALQGLMEIFSKNGKAVLPYDSSPLVEELYKEIGKLKVENEWLKKKSEILIS